MADPTVADFKDKFPEFFGTPDDIIANAIADAATTHPASVWGASREGTDPLTKRDLGILYKAAMLVSLNPRAKCVRLDPKNPDTIYDKRHRELARSVYRFIQVL